MTDLFDNPMELQLPATNYEMLDERLPGGRIGALRG